MESMGAQSLNELQSSQVSLQLICRSGTRRFNLSSTGARSSDELQRLDLKIGYQDSGPSTGHQGELPYHWYGYTHHTECEYIHSSAKVIMQTILSPLAELEWWSQSQMLPIENFIIIFALHVKSGLQLVYPNITYIIFSPKILITDNLSLMGEQIYDVSFVHSRSIYISYIFSLQHAILHYVDHAITRPKFIIRKRSIFIADTVCCLAHSKGISNMMITKQLGVVSI